MSKNCEQKKPIRAKCAIIGTYNVIVNKEDGLYIEVIGKDDSQEPLNEAIKIMRLEDEQD